MAYKGSKHRIAQNLTILRQKMGLSQKKFVELFDESGYNITHKCYQTYEEGRSEPRIDFVKLFAKTHKVSMDDLCYKEFN